jgi:hypothetical protein
VDLGISRAVFYHSRRIESSRLERIIRRGNSLDRSRNERTPEDFPIPICLSLHGIQRHHEIAVGSDEQDGLGEIPVQDVEVRKSPCAPRAVNRLIKGLDGGHKVAGRAILRLDFRAGIGKGTHRVISPKGLELTHDNSANGLVVFRRELSSVDAGSKA